jgi:hypothetical protein
MKYQRTNIPALIIVNARLFKIPLLVNPIGSDPNLTFMKGKMTRKKCAKYGEDALGLHMNRNHIKKFLIDPLKATIF